ncbi:Ig-like domain-containing protein [Agarivorans sp. Alg241-V36]|uniref:beta strand repeat-containing protein n=1 Tax=Agarivorans sp. Alg241-V36 TaxID=2305992 RepID=UPI0013D7720D|nr:Ig-like domain-containing protein [Agarivorans sp. Alg241-V36]
MKFVNMFKPLFYIAVMFFALSLSGCVFDSADKLNVTKLQISLLVEEGDSTPGSIPRGFSKNIVVTATLFDGTTRDLTNYVVLNSSDQDIVSIVGNKANAIKAGSSIVTASYNGVESNVVNISVSAATLVDIQLTPAQMILPVGIEHSYQALATFTDESVLNITDKVSWETGSPSVVSINAGELKTLAPGITTLSAELLGIKSNVAELEVTNAELLSIQLTPSEGVVARGTTLEYVAIGTFADNSTLDISSVAVWSSSVSSVAIIENGLATSIVEGGSVITASLNGVTSNSAELTVSPEELVSIQVTPALSSLPEGGTQNYIATGYYTDGSTQDISNLVTWDSSATEIATIVNGLATAVDEGSSVISAGLNGVSNNATLTVTEEELTSIQVTPALSSLPEGSAQAYIATGTYTDGSTLDISNLVAWHSSATDVATIVTGLATAVDEGTSVISASLNGVSSSATLTVTEEELTGIQVTPALSSLPEGSVQAYIATGTYTDGSTSDISNLVAWNSSATNVATIVNGLATAVYEGLSVISASLNGISDSATLTVTEEELTSIQITPAVNSIAKGTTQTYLATGTYSDKSTQDISSLVAWSSSNTSVATIVDGLASAVLEGSATIGASLNGLTSDASLTVTAEELVSIQVTPTSTSMAKGNTQTYIATGTYTDGNTRNISSLVAWNSSNSGAATVVGGLATAVLEGNTTISANLNGRSSAATLTVTAEELVSIQILPATSSIAKGNTQTYTAIGTYTDNSTVDISTLVAWNSSNTGIATIVNGLATAVLEGTVTITANLSSINSNNVNLTVTAAELVSIQVSSTSSTIMVTRNSDFTAMGHYTDGSTADISSTASWNSTNTSVATVVAGAATAVMQGSTDISANQNGKTSPLESLTVTPVITECGVASAAGNCIKVSPDASGKLYTNNPSTTAIIAMGYTVDNTVNNTGLSYHNTYTEDGSYGPPGVYARMTQNGAGGISQYERYCADLNTLAFDSKTNWRPVESAELEGLFAEHGNMFVKFGWSAFYGYWSNTVGPLGIEFVALHDGYKASTTSGSFRPVSCVSEP